MKRKEIVTIVVVILGLMFWHAEVSAEPMGTAFTYQGRLLDANGPSDGLYDFQFKLYDNANVIDGNQVGSDVNVPDVDVIDGYFTVVLEFGCDVFNGDARWLEIEVRQADSNDPNDFITLNPRQEVTPTPYALQTRGIFVDGIENVGIGTDMPFEKLEVDHGNLLVQGIGSFDSVDEEAFLYLGDNNHYIKSEWGFGVSIGTWEVDPAIVVRETTGRVGIGTIDPQKNLSIQATRPQIALAESGGDTGVVEFHEEANQLRFQYWTDYGATWMRDMMVLDGNTGNVGIGTRDPGSRLDIKAASGYSDGGLRITSSINDNQVITLQDATPGDQGQITVKGGGTNKIILRANGDTYFNGGNVGIGTTTPEKKLTIQSTRPQIALVENGGNAGILEFHEQENQLRLQYWTDYGSTWDTTIMTLDGDSGNVGIGTTAPVDKLHVKSRIRIEGSDTSFPFLDLVNRAGTGRWTLYGNNDNDFRIAEYVGTLRGDRIVIKEGGNVGIGTTSPGAKLEVVGRTKTSELEITGGSDLSEHFDIDDAEEEIEPGMVVCIDPQNPGKLDLSRKAYDRKVAGIVSGAGGVRTGLLMGQKDSVASGVYPVALTGRVYCRADASSGSIRPGDLLTTSDTPGHAMKVSNYELGQGAILGKAMSSLEEGRGLVLVLIALQ